MSLTAKQPEGSSIEPIEIGNHQAVCYSVVDLGTQRNEYFDKQMRQVAITWEIPSLRIELVRDNVKVNLPRAITKTYTISLHEKANLYKDLVSWRGKVFTPEELEGFNLRNILKVNCLLQIVHNKKGDKTYANVAAVTGLPKGMEVLIPENPTVTYDMTENGYELPQNVPEWIRDIIKKSMEYQAVHSAQENTDLAAAQEEYGGETARDKADDDIPF